MNELDSALLGLVRAMPGACWLKGEDGRYVYVSATSQQYFGPIDGSAVGRTTHDLFPPDIADELEAGDRRALVSGEATMEPAWLPESRGGRRHLAIVKFPVRTDARSYIAGLAFDITAMSTASWDASTYRQILDAINDFIIVKGPRSKLLWANRAFLAAYGMSNAELQGLVDAPFVEPDVTQGYVRDDESVFSTGRTVEVPQEHITRWDGTVLTCHTVKSAIFDERGKVAMSVAVSRDITAQRRLELELRQAQKLESIGRLASGLAHEINTPIQYVGDQVAFAHDAVDDLLALTERYRALVAKVEAGTATPADAALVREAEVEADLEFVSERLPSALAAAQEGARRVAAIVRAMKEFGHPDAGRHGAADLNASLRSTLTVAANEYKYVADVALELGDIPPVRCNVSELNQVFLNLIVNAAHAIGELPEPTQRGVIRVTSRQDGDDVVISVGDTGAGIPEHVRSRIFDPFFTTKPVGRGTGQGLAIARMIVVEKHHGSLTFETELGRGTTFHVRIPCVPPAAEAA
ncbi:MAG: PAS domain-containing protein [Myxococcota bacterium]